MAEDDAEKDTENNAEKEAKNNAGKEAEKASKKPRIVMSFEPMFTKKILPAVQEKPRLIRDIEEYASHDALPTQPPSPGKPLVVSHEHEEDKMAEDVTNPDLDKSQKVEEARRIWREREEEKAKHSTLGKFKKILGMQ